ncbi:ribosome biogenesis protein tsr1 [Ceratocystis pirilliformis]|uniref:Ribosome biogenesis protein tsr1 n=1 Tax=Ceratocystis pirilliformis TaxID=259994 RepID=A0ABR3YUC6_9PEZI
MNHSHRPTTKANPKSFKSRKATKGSLREAAKGRMGGSEFARRTPHQHVMSKLDRKNQARQRLQAKRKEHLQETHIFNGQNGAPRIVAVVPLCVDTDSRLAVQKLNESLDIASDFTNGPIYTPIDRFKQKLQYLAVPRNLDACLNATRVADFVVVLLSASEEVDQLGELMLRGIESQGLSTLFTAVDGLEGIEPAKQRTNVLASLKSFITHFHPEQEKIFSLDNRVDSSNLMRVLCNSTPKGIKWREERSWMLIEDIQLPEDFDGQTVVTGVVRGKGLKADRLVQIGDWGTFQVDQIVAAPRPTNRKGVDAATSPQAILDIPSADKDTIEGLAPEEIIMEDDDMQTEPTQQKGVLLDDYHYFSEEELEEYTIKKRVPKGTSKYQSAWFLEDNAVDDDSASDMEDMDMDNAEDSSDESVAAPEDGIEGRAEPAMTEGAPSEYPASEMIIEPDEEQDAADLASYRKLKRTEMEDDKEFPDEIELSPNVLARERLSRYRGLKSLRTSEWVVDEDRAHEPEDWRRLLRVSDYQGTRSRVTREALVGGVAPGTRVSVYISGAIPEHVKTLPSAALHPVTLFSLLRHEHKQTVSNVLINLSSEYPTSIKSKEELIMQCGARRFIIKPLFSQPGNTPNNVHKYARYLHPGQSAVATFTGPVTWGPVPALFFKRTADVENVAESSAVPSSSGLTLVATGTCLPPSTTRVIAKRIILTGHPYHIHKRVVTIRYMFFNKEDVEWFKALPLWTKRGRTGFIKETLGTHGYFKATFDSKINPQDAVGVSLYKRVFPRKAIPLTGSLSGAVASEKSDDDEGDDQMEM